MFLQLAHTKLEVFTVTKRFCLECYRLTKGFPSEERYNMISQLRRAALSAHLNVAEGSSRRTEVDRKRFFEIARGSVIEVDTVFGLAVDLQYCSVADLATVGPLIIEAFKILSGLISATPKS